MASTSSKPHLIASFPSTMPLHKTDRIPSATRDAQFEAEVRHLLAGAPTKPFAHDQADIHKYSRSQIFAKRNDVSDHTVQLVRNALPPVYIEAALRHEAGSSLTSRGALSVRSGAKTGRSPKDKRIVKEPTSADKVWWGPVNIPLSEMSFMINRERAIDYLNTRERLFVVDAFAGWDQTHRIKVRIITTRAYHGLFMRNMLIRPTDEELHHFGEPDFVILNAGEFPANRYVEGMTSPASVDLHFGRNEMVILGTQYAGEMKKGVLTLMMYEMTKRGHLCLHSSANENPITGDVTMFFGLSGTGKTTLSADPHRLLIGDDEHVWTDKGVFNIEGGCYAKCINLTAESEPEIFHAIKFGAIVENVMLSEDTRDVMFEDTSITANTRCAYPLHYIPNAKIPAIGGHPNNVILLTCDGFGVLPPVSRLTREQVIYHFVQGYTSKMAGTEEGVLEPIATFSSCYGEPFLVFPPLVYATMLADKLEQHDGNAWLVNTGWIGGKVGQGGHRIKLKYTRAIVDAINSGQLAKIDLVQDPVFKLWYPQTCPGVPHSVLNPASAWEDKVSFADTQRALARLFNINFEKYVDAAPKNILQEGPSVL